MSDVTQRKAYELGRDWQLSDGVLTTSELCKTVNTDIMKGDEFVTHWIQVERGMQGKPFETISEV